MTTPVQIRPATPDDYQILADFSRKTFYHTYAAFNTPENMVNYVSENFLPEKISSELLDEKNIYRLAFANNKLTGYILMRIASIEGLENDNPIELCRIYTDRLNPLPGIGSALMNEAVRVAQSLKKNCIWLGVWENNQHAIAFYRKHGFEQFGTHIFMLGDDPQTDLLLKRKILIEQES
jgi:ribosomal protein S18 acetylase RimI-like enzyme